MKVVCIKSDRICREAETESKSGEHKTRFVITMTGLSDSFHRKMDGEEESDIAPKKHKLVKVEKGMASHSFV